ncbi:c6 transcription factor [Neofusicoccum parvum]|uniref:C6 transcription factor n=1 Tax=Neofusicoccum parvum TaxID=310453 RepID=A0ACB5SH89_9PEZI|nr:c6 transcription factor [Neofusicoccum parvum]
MPKGVRKWRLHHFMFDFRGHQGPLRDPLAEVHIRKEIGDAFIAEYFKTIHPQLPVLVQSEIEETWAKFWDTPAIDPKPLKGKELVLIVLALGARVSCVNGKYEASQLENWAAYFAERTELSSTFMLSPNLKATHFMLLKAMYSLQLMKQNDAYLYLGYAARSALSLGIHKSEVVQVGENWQEIQRAQIGMRYYLMRILIHRPALTYATFFPSRAEAQRTAGNLFDIQTSIAVSVTCAKSIIHIASELCSRRNPDMKQDGGVSFYLLIACITLLFDVLDPATTPEYAKATFEAVESGIQVLDTMQHIGPNNSKELSLDIMKFAKDAVLSGGEDIDLERDLTGSFPWLR